MTRFLTCGTLVACVLGVLGTAGHQQPTFRGGSDTVRVFVTVTDRDGRFDNTPQPIRLIVMLDVSGSMEGNLPLLRAAGAQLFARLRTDDVARVGAFGHEVTISPSFTHDPDELGAAMPTAIASDAPTPLWRAIDQAMEGFGKGDDRRKVILVLSDGKDTDSLSFRRRPVSQAGVIDRARQENVMIYAVGMRSRSTRSMPPGIGRGGLEAMMLADMPDPGLARVAEETGGGYTEIRFGQDLGAAFAGVADELHTQYLLGFAPPKRDGKIHDINVRITQGGLKPRARKSYVAPKE
jgi:Ca-activated chloride channel family protein